MRSNGFTIILCRSFAAARLSALLTVPAFAQIPGCSDKFADEADTAVGGVNTWDAFASWYRRYAVCDDGDIAESMDGVTARLLDGRWADLMHAGPVFNRNDGLQKFLVRHIDAVGLTRQAADALRRRAETQCSTTIASLCKAIEQAAKEMVSEQSGE